MLSCLKSLERITDMAKGLKDMFAETVSETASPIRGKRVRTKSKHRAGYGSFRPTVIMKNLNGQFVNVKRDDVLKHLSLGWATVARSVYRKSLNGGNVAPAVSSVVVVKRKNKEKK